MRWIVFAWNIMDYEGFSISGIARMTWSRSYETDEMNVDHFSFFRRRAEHRGLL